MTPVTGLFVNLRGPWEPLLSPRVLIFENIFWYEVLLHHLLLPMGLFFFPAFVPLSPYWCQGMPIAFLINYFLLFLHCRLFFVNPKSYMLLSASLAYVTIVTEGFDKHTISSETLKGCCLSLWPSASVQKETFYNLDIEDMIKSVNTHKEPALDNHSINLWGLGGQCPMRKSWLHVNIYSKV